jgi:hypothetical protein
MTTYRQIAGTDIAPLPFTAIGETTAQDLAHRFGNAVTVEDFGAIGDGVTNDTAAFTSAIATGNPIQLSAKTYLIDGFSVDTSAAQFILLGIPGRSTIKRGAVVGGAFVSIAAANVYLDGAIFDMNSGAISANQWGVRVQTFVAQGQMTIARRCKFINNSGTLGGGLAVLGQNPVYPGSVEISDCEFYNHTWVACYIGSMGSGLIKGNYIHDCPSGSAGSYTTYLTVSSSNYASNGLILGNRIERCNSGWLCGGIGPPYVFATPASATNCKMIGNECQDITRYALVGQGDYIDTIGNMITQSASGVPVFTAIGYMGRWGRIADNSIVFFSTAFNCIDVGGCQYLDVSDNHIVSGAGAINIGGTTHCSARGNYIHMVNTSLGAPAFYILEIEGDGQGTSFPYPCSGLVLDNNYIVMDGANSRGIESADNPCGRSGTFGMQITNNRFEVVNSASNIYCIALINSGNSVRIKNNTVNGVSWAFTTVNGNGDLVYNDVYDELIISSGTANIRSVLSQQQNTYQGQNMSNLQSILWVYPNVGGSGYTQATTTLAASGSGGGTGWTGQAKVSQGAIVGVHVTNPGSGYSGTITITATSSGGGSGATFIVGNQMFTSAQKEIIIWATGGSAVLTVAGGGGTSIAAPEPIGVNTKTMLKLRSGYNTSVWQVLGDTPKATYAVGSLPTAAAANNGQIVYVNGSATNKWMARSNGTNWLWNDGTIVS